MYDIDCMHREKLHALRKCIYFYESKHPDENIFNFFKNIFGHKLKKNYLKIYLVAM